MSIDRQPAVAGAFYPANPAILSQQVDALLAGVATAPQAQTHPKALIVPHAGYRYSGPIAASAYAQLAPIAARIRRVVLLGPAHRLPFRGLAYPGAERLLTPLGAVDLDREALAGLADLLQVQQLDAAFDDEHCLEVQLPFLQRLLTDFRLVPLVVGTVAPAAVAQVLERLWGGDETLIVISSDLSHYLDYETARRHDAATTQAIERLDPAALDHHAACGATPLAGLLVAARGHGMQVRALDLRNSGDTAGSHDQVVGYGAYVFF
ncbi:AmmeMemoRadiSam system protein B [uncultured Thiodictyon sp.]|uniref:AmmeMemoRadiSam system protein B n=1 Tax=uncultured Thiodictyon sp. TaxID=1846217 RepID=UPI0025EBA1A3|nr:AmmeMemoRadiSam system protein B [uncultured Thiodictyon sp.]